MENYNFWQDFFDTYQSLSDWMKFAWLIVPPLFLFGFFTLIMRYRLESKNAEGLVSGDLVYTVHSDGFDGFQIRRHGKQFGQEPTILLLEQNITVPVEPQRPSNKP